MTCLDSSPEDPLAGHPAGTSGTSGGDDERAERLRGGKQGGLNRSSGRRGRRGGHKSAKAAAEEGEGARPWKNLRFDPLESVQHGRLHGGLFSLCIPKDLEHLLIPAATSTSSVGTPWTTL